MMTPTLPQLIETYTQLSQGVSNYGTYTGRVYTHHSTALEGSSLTLLETLTLLEKGLTAGGKEFTHHLMALDHQQALDFCLEQARQRVPISPKLLQQIAALVMRRTGGPTHTLLGTFDSSTGDYRTVSPMAGSRIFMDARKVPAAVEKFCRELNTTLANVKTIRQGYDLSFQAHYQLISIHPFGDGNGRTARLVMAMIQHQLKLPLSLVYAEDRTAYIRSLEETRARESPQPLLTFMHGQLTRFLTDQINLLQQPTPEKQTPDQKQEHRLRSLFK